MPGEPGIGKRGGFHAAASAQWLVVGGLLPWLGSASCGNGEALYPVSGKVTYKGSPAAGATVVFSRRGADAADASTIVGIVQEDGTFELVCGSFGKGAPQGDYDVLVEWKRVSASAKRRPQSGPDRLKGRYADPARPQLHAVVKADTNVLPPFELKD